MTQPEPERGESEKPKPENPKPSDPEPPTTSSSTPPPSTQPPLPAVPSGLSASLSGGSVSLSWTDPGDASISSYEYRIKTVGAGNAYGIWTRITHTVNSGTSTATIGSVVGPERRIVQLRAVNATGSGDHAIASTGVPAVPSGLRASLSGGSVSLSWDDPGDDSIRSYDYRIKTAGSGNAYGAWMPIANSGASTTSATIAVAGSDRRIVQLRANGSGTSESATASDKPPALLSGFSTPGGSFLPRWNELNVVDYLPAGSPAGPPGSIVVRWSDPGDESILKYQYRFRAQSRPDSYSQWIDIPGSGASTTSHTFVFPTPEMYRVRLRAVNSAGGGEGRTAIVINVKPFWPALAAPSGLKADLKGSSVHLSWDNPFDGSIYKYAYRIKTVGAGSSWSKWQDVLTAGSNSGISSSGTISATITVTGSERRIIQLRAHRRSLGDPSSSATASTGVPALLSGFSTPGGSFLPRWNELNVVDYLPAGSPAGPPGSIVVRWSDPGDESILKYQYRFRAQSRPDSYSQWIDIPGSGASTTSHTFVFPTPEMYRVRLRAVNSAGGGEGRTAIVINVKPFWPALAAPSGLKADLKGSSVHLSWDNPFDGSIYKYAYRIKTVGAGSSWSKWQDVLTAGSNSGISSSGTISATITVTGSERRIIQLRAHRRSLGDPSSSAEVSTE